MYLFISVINQLDAQNFCFTVSLLHASTYFEHMCSKHVEALSKLTVKQKFCASSWLITEIDILRCNVSKTSKKKLHVVHINGRIVGHMKFTKVRTPYFNKKATTERTWNCALIVVLFWDLQTGESTTIGNMCVNILTCLCVKVLCRGVQIIRHINHWPICNMYLLQKTRNLKEIS